MPFLKYLISWSRSRPLSFWGVLIQWVGFSIYFFFVNTYVAAIFLSLFVGYFSANIINVYASYVKDKDDTKVPSR